MTKTAVFLATLLAAAGAQAACYTVLGPQGQILLQSSTPPVDMSLHLHQTVPQRFGTGATMVFGIADPPCGPPVDAWYDGPATPVVYREGQQPVRAVRAPRRDRE